MAAASLALAQQLYVLSEPRTLFRESVRSLVEAAAPDLRLPRARAVKVEMTEHPVADSVSARRAIPWLGHVITVHRGLLQLIFDAVQILMARTQITSHAGHVLTGEHLSEEDASRILAERIRSYVTYGSWHKSPELDTLWLQQQRRELYGPDHLAKPWFFWLSHTARFIMAHELGHIYYEHSDQPRSEDQRKQWGEELLADEFGAILHAAYIRRLAEKEFGRPYGVEYIVSQVTALSAVAVLFELFAAIEHAAQALCVRWSTAHPPADMRYSHYQLLHLKTPLCRVELFTDRVADMNTPIETRALVHDLLKTIRW